MFIFLMNLELELYANGKTIHILANYAKIFWSI